MSVSFLGRAGFEADRKSEPGIIILRAKELGYRQSSIPALPI
jgi:hypothetical protein